MKTLALRVALLFALAFPSLSQTQIVDTLYTSDSTPFSGILRISWRPFVTADGHAVAAGNRTITVANGVINISLWPTQGAGPATSYTVETRQGNQFIDRELWGVPTASPATLASVRNVVYSGNVGGGGVLTAAQIGAAFTGTSPCFLNKDGTCSASTGGGVWGSITGTLTNQTDLVSALGGKESTLTFSTPLNRSVNTISIQTASGSQPGALSAADWTTFNSKLSANQSITFTPSADLSCTGGSGATSLTPACTVTAIGNISLPPFSNGVLTYTAGVLSWAAAGGTGTVTSVNVAVPSWLTSSGGPVTTSGTITLAAASGQTANSFLASPDGTTGAVSLRTIVSGDLPTVPRSKGGLNSTSAGTGFLRDGSTPSAGELSGDVTTSAGFAATIANNAVTNAKAAQMAANTFKSNNTGSTANAADITVAQAKTLLAIAATDVSGLATVATTGAYSDLTGKPTIPTIASVTNLLAGSGSGNASDSGIATTAVVTKDGSGNVSIAGAISTGSGGSNAGLAAFNCSTQSLAAAGTNSVGVIGPTSCSGKHFFALPTAGSAGNQVMLFGAESSNISPVTLTAFASTSLSDTANLIRTSTSCGGDLSGTFPNCTVAQINGVAAPASPSVHQLLVITATNTGTYKTLPNCTDTTGNHLNYTQSTDLFSCGTSSVATFAAPALTLSTTNSAGVATTAIRSDAQIAIFDATVPTVTTPLIASATGSAAIAARRDHTHQSPGAIGSIVADVGPIADTETQIIRAVIPANFFTSGSSFEAIAYGTCTTVLTPGNGTWAIRIGTNGTTGNNTSLGTVVVALTASQSAKAASVHIRGTVRVGGSSGTAIANGEVRVDPLINATAGAVSANTATGAFDATASNNLDLTYKSGKSDSNCTWRNAEVIVTKM